MISSHGTAVQSDALDTLNAYLDEEFGRPAVSGASKSGWSEKRERFDAAGLARKDIQAEDGIRDRSPSRGLGDVYKRQQLK